MTKSLDELAGVRGVVLAAEFNEQGELADYRGDLSKEIAAQATQFTHAVTTLFGVLAGAFSTLARSKWLPQQGWMYAGGDFTVATSGRRLIFIRTSQADFNQLYNDLVRP